MAGIREVARQYRDEIMDGIAWVAIWKIGKSWNAKAFWLNTDSDMIEDEDMQEARDIVAADANAIFINEHYCAHMGEGKLEDIVSGIRFHYENGCNMLKDSAAYKAEEEKEIKNMDKESAEASLNGNDTKKKSLPRFKEVRTVSWDEVRSLCIAKRWYTKGNNEQYSALAGYIFNLEKVTTEDLVYIASDILEHSNTEYDLEAILWELNKVCNTYFVHE